MNLKKFIVKFIFIIFLIVFLVLASYTLYLKNYYNQSLELKEDHIIIIQPGESLHHLATKLKNQNIIENSFNFKIIGRILNISTKIKAGEYLIKKNSNIKNIISDIINSNVILHNITIPEGLMSFEILDIIKNAPFLKGQTPDFLEEGSILPETYNYYYGQSRISLINQMQLAMDNIVDKIWKNNKNTQIKSKEELIILASIIEKETSIESERRIISSVFTNRLKKNMRLQTDPTVIYSITKGQYKLNRPLYYKDLTLEDEHNTYVKFGLPPTPIANPGIKSLEAAANPKQTDYLYFVAKEKGEHNFSTNYEDHLKFVRKWRIINNKK